MLLDFNLVHPFNVPDNLDLRIKVHIHLRVNSFSNGNKIKDILNEESAWLLLLWLN